MDNKTIKGKIKINKRERTVFVFISNVLLSILI